MRQEAAAGCPRSPLLKPGQRRAEVLPQAACGDLQLATFRLVGRRLRLRTPNLNHEVLAVVLGVSHCVSLV